MKKTRHTEEQIAFALKQAETGTSVAEVIRRMGISEQTFYRWKKVYGGLGVGELRCLKLLEEENRKLKQLVADLSLDKHILQDVLAKKTLTPRRRRELVAHVQASHGVSERRGCLALGVDRSSVRYVSHRQIRHRSCCASVIWPRRGRGMATSASTSCCAGRDGS